MAYFDKTEYGKYVELQNVSGSGDPADAPAGGIYLFASGTAGNAKLYLQNEGVSSPLSLADGGTLQIAGDSGTDTVNMADDTFTIAGGEGVVSTVTDNQVSLAVSVADLSTSMTGDLEDTDEFAISDGGTMKKVDFSVVRDAVFADVSGDATVAAGGALTIAAGAVEEGMLNDNVISGQDELAHADIADADEFLISDGGTLKRVGVDSLRDHYFGVVSGDATVADGGALTLGADVVDGSNIADDSIDSEHIVLGALDSEHYASGSIQGGHIGNDEIDSQHYAAGSIDNEHLAADSVNGAKIADDSIDSEHIVLGALDAEHYSSGSVENGHLANDSVTLTAGAGMATIGEVELGASITVAVDGVLEDLDTLGAPSADGEFIVATGAGAFAYESGATARTSLGLGTGDSPEFASLQVSDLTDNRVVIAGASGELEDDANFTFDGSTLKLGAAMSGSGNAQFAGGLIVEGAQNAFSGSVIFGPNGYNGTGATITSGGAISGKGNLTIDGTAQFAGGYGSSGVDITAAGAISADGALTVGSDGAGVNFTVYGAAANERMMYDAGNHVLQFRDSSGATMLNLGGDATSEYALDVANGSDNINKVRAAAFVTYSDESLKSDVETMNTALDTVMSLNGVEFTWKDSGERDFGFIAQDVQSVLPKAVHVAEDGVQGVDYSRLTSVLVEAVKAQQVQIEELKAILKK